MSKILIGTQSLEGHGIEHLLSGNRKSMSSKLKSTVRMHYNSSTLRGFGVLGFWGFGAHAMLLLCSSFWHIVLLFASQS